MNYERIYNEFIADRRGKEANLIASGEYKERHHIVPRSMGGTDDASNIIALTAGDHYFAHLCLAKAYGGRKHWGAVWAMSKLSNKDTTPRRTLRRKFIDIARKNSLCGDNNYSKTEAFKIQVRGNKNPSKRKEVRLKISERVTASWASLGRKEKHAKDLLDRWSNPKFRETVSGPNHYINRMGNQERLDLKEKISKANRGENHYTKSNPDKYTGANHANAVCIINIDTGKIYETRKSAALETGACGAHISSCCTGKRKKAGGFRWAYA
jgi:hypothetical protein